MKAKNLSFALRCLISVLLVGYILSKIDLGKVFQILQQLEIGWAMAGSFLVPCMIFFLAGRWNLFLRRRNIVLPFRKILILTWTGQFFNSVLPGSTGGDVFKIYQVCRINPNGKMIAAGTVIADRCSALIALVLLILFSWVRDPLLLGKLWEGTGTWQLPPGMVILAVIAGVGLTALLFYGLNSAPLKARILHLFRVLLGAAWDHSFLKAVAFSLFIHGLSFLSFFCLARALSISITFPQVLMILPVLLFVVLLPVTVNGHGLREIVTIFFFQHLGIGTGTTGGLAETVVALSFVLLINDLLWNLPAGVWYLCRRETS